MAAIHRRYSNTHNRFYRYHGRAVDLPQPSGEVDGFQVCGNAHQQRGVEVQGTRGGLGTGHGRHEPQQEVEKLHHGYIQQHFVQG